MAYNLIDSGFIMKTAKYKEVKEAKADSEAKKWIFAQWENLNES